MSRSLRLTVAAFVALIVFFAGIADVSAHRDDQSYLYLDVGEELQARLQMPFPDVQTVLGVDLTSDGVDIEGAIEDNADLFGSYAAAHVALGSEGQTYALTITKVARATDDLNYVEVWFDVDTNGPLPTGVTVTLDPFFDEIEDRDALLLVGNDFKRGVIDSEADILARLTPDGRTASTVFGEASQWNNLRASIGLGVDHIRTGPDHMLFVVALLLPSVLIWRDKWLPAEGFGSALLRITKVMTMFTLAHSVTFTLAGLGLLPSPGPKVTETIIALSIAATALHNLRPVIVNREWVIALVFGLFHGFGFASLISELEVGTATELISLAGRNVGIEIGQLVVVLVSFPALFLLRRTRYYRPAFITGCIALRVVSFGCLFERLWGGRAITSAVIDRLTAFPWVLISLGVITALAAALFVKERDNGRLLATASRTTSDGQQASELVTA